MSPVHRYLLSILSFYAEKGSEKYVLSKLVNSDNLPTQIQALFCRKCLVLFVPIVNCTTELTNNAFLIQCSTCDLKMSVELDLEQDVGARATEMRFEDLFS